MSRVKEEITNILIIRNDRFGEFLLNIPAIRALKETFLKAKITLIVAPYVKDLAKCVPFIDEIIAWKTGGHSLREKFNFLKMLKKKNFDLAIILNPSKEFNVFTYLAGIPMRAGYARKWGFLLTHKIEDKKYLGDKHEVEYNLDLAGLIGAKTQDLTLVLNTDGYIINSLIQEFDLGAKQNLVALHPWTSDSLKLWPIESFCALAKLLINALGVNVMVIGGPEEAGKAAAAFKDFDSRLMNLTGKTSLSQLAALLRKTRLLVSGDSGPVHLACCVGTPVIAIFRNDIPAKGPKRWGPWGEGHCVVAKNNLYDITVEEVFNKTKERLER